MWSTEVIASVHYEHWSNLDALAYLGGPTKASLPSTTPGQFFDPLAPFELSTAGVLDVDVVTNARRGSTSSSLASSSSPPPGWYYASSYNAVWGQMTNVTGKFLQGRNSKNVDGCESQCAARADCAIFAWSATSTHCWFRLDDVWGSPETIHSEAGRISGCRTGTNASTGAPLVRGCGTNPAGGSGGGGGSRFYYGASWLCICFTLPSRLISPRTASSCRAFSLTVHQWSDNDTSRAFTCLITVSRCWPLVAAASLS